MGYRYIPFSLLGLHPLYFGQTLYLLDSHSYLFLFGLRFKFAGNRRIPVIFVLFREPEGILCLQGINFSAEVQFCK